MKMTAGIFGAVVMAAFGTYYFRNKKRNRKQALLCKALATAVPGILLLGYLCGTRTGESAGSIVSGWADSVTSRAAFAGTLAAIVFYMAADVLLECRFVWGAVSFGVGHICMAAGFLLSGETVLVWKKSGGFSVDAGLLGLTLAVCAVFVAAAWAALHRYFHSLKKKKLLYPLLAYVLVLSMMAALAVTAGGVVPPWQKPAGKAQEQGARRAGTDPVLCSSVSLCNAAVDVNVRMERIKLWHYFMRFIIYSGEI